MASSVEVARISARRRAVFDAVAKGVPIDLIAENVGVSVTTCRKDYALAKAEQERIETWTKSATSKRRRK